jgi:hypothetical protein
MFTVGAFQVHKALTVAFLALDFVCEMPPNGFNVVDIKGVWGSIRSLEGSTAMISVLRSTILICTTCITTKRTAYSGSRHLLT